MIRAALLVLFTVACFLLALLVMNTGTPGTPATAPAKPGATAPATNPSDLPGGCPGCPLPSN